MQRKLTDAEQSFVLDALSRFAKARPATAAEASEARDAFLREMADAGIISTQFGYRTDEHAQGDAV